MVFCGPGGGLCLKVVFVVPAEEAMVSLTESHDSRRNKSIISVILVYFTHFEE